MFRLSSHPKKTHVHTQNFGAGMSGGIAYVYDPDKQLAGLCNVDVKGDLLQVEVSEKHLREFGGLFCIMGERGHC